MAAPAIHAALKNLHGSGSPARGIALVKRQVRLPSDRATSPARPRGCGVPRIRPAQGRVQCAVAQPHSSTIHPYPPHPLEWSRSPAYTVETKSFGLAYTTIIDRITFLLSAIFPALLVPVPPCSKGRFMSVARRGAGCGGRAGAKDVSRRAEAQAAMIRPTGRGSPAEDTKTSRPAMPVNGVCPPGLSQSKPHTPRIAVKLAQTA
jgi:hypothetical protein